MVGEARSRLRGERPLGVSDQPIAGSADDTLSLAREAFALADFVARSVTPITIAIQGDWGTGKTSLLRIIEERLDPKTDGHRRDPDGPIQVVRFETWQYAQFGGGPALPLSLLSMLDRRLSPASATSQAANIIRRLARPVANAAIRFGTAGIIDPNDDTAALMGSGSGVDFAEECDRLHQALSDTIARKREQGVERIVVLIDDLDRVDPPLAIDILQRIKMFLDLESCVFVLALDFAVVKDGVRRKFGIEDERKARAFFDKIIQLPFQVPVSRYDSTRFVKHLVQALNDPGLGSEQVGTLVDLARRSVSSNPRAIKRVMNSLHLQKLLSASRLDEIGSERSAAMTTLFGLLCLQARYPEAYDWLVNEPDLVEALNRLMELQGNVEDRLLEDLGYRDGLDLEAFPGFANALSKLALGLLSSKSGAFETIVAMTRSTSIEEQGSPYKFTSEMRSANKAIMDRVLSRCQQALPTTTITQEAKSGGALEIWSEVRPGIRLSLEHALDWLGLSVYTDRQSERAEIAKVFPGAVIASDGSVHIWEEPVSVQTDMETRRGLLEAAPREFVDAWNSLGEAEDVVN